MFKINFAYSFLFLLALTGFEVSQTTSSFAFSYKPKAFRRLIQIQAPSRFNTLSVKSIIGSVGTIVSKTVKGQKKYYIIATAHGLINILKDQEVFAKKPFSQNGDQSDFPSVGWIADPLIDMAIIEIQCNLICQSLETAEFHPEITDPRHQWVLVESAQDELFSNPDQFWIAGRYRNAKSKPQAIVPFSNWNLQLTSEILPSNNSRTEFNFGYSQITHEYLSHSGVTQGMSGSPLFIQDAIEFESQFGPKPKYMVAATNWIFAGIVTKRLRFFEETYFSSTEQLSRLLGKYDLGVRGNLSDVRWAEEPDFYFRKSPIFSEVDPKFVADSYGPGSSQQTGGGGTADGSVALIKAGGGGTADGGLKNLSPGESIFGNFGGSNLSNGDSVLLRTEVFSNFLKNIKMTNQKWMDIPQYLTVMVDGTTKTIIAFRMATEQLNDAFLLPTVELYSEYLYKPQVLTPIYLETNTLYDVLLARIGASNRNFLISNVPTIADKTAIPINVTIKGSESDQSICINLKSPAGKPMGSSKIKIVNLRPLNIIKGQSPGSPDYIIDLSGVIYHGIQASFTEHYLNFNSMSQVLFNLLYSPPYVRVRELNSVKDFVIFLDKSVK